MGSGIKIKCMKCEDIIQSMYRHDYKCCSCGAISIDGGSDYTKVTGNIWDIGYPDDTGSEYKPMAFKELSVDKETKEVIKDFDCTLLDGLDDWDDWDCNKWEDKPVNYPPRDMLGAPRIEGDD